MENNQKINARIDAIFISSQKNKDTKTDTFQQQKTIKIDTFQNQDSTVIDTTSSSILDSTTLKKPTSSLIKALKATINRDTNHADVGSSIKKPIHSGSAALYQQKYNSKSTAPASKVYKRLINQNADIDISSANNFYETLDSVDIRDVLTRAQSDLSRDRDELLSIKNVNQDLTKSSEKYLLRLNQQYSWAFICVIFLFIGAPLGSIIRKGGYGYPLLVAILFYMIFIITTILGEKLIRNDSMGGIQAAWLPCLLLAPFAVLLTFMAIRDSRLNPMALVEMLVRLRKSKDVAK